MGLPTSRAPDCLAIHGGRPPRRRPRVFIVAEPPSSMATSVAIVRLPDDLSKNLPEIVKLGNAEALEVTLLQSLRTICELDEPLHCIGPTQNPANLKTVTVNRNIGRYNGLHVDDWDRLHLDSRHLATNRICVNIGQDDRYFLFLPFSLMDIAKVLSEEMAPGWEVPRRYTMIGRQFMERFPGGPGHQMPRHARRSVCRSDRKPGPRRFVLWTNQHGRAVHHTRTHSGIVVRVRGPGPPTAQATLKAGLSLPEAVRSAL